MGRTTFEPALAAPSWPWGDLRVYVLGSKRPPGTPEQVVVDDNPVRLLERLRQDNHGGDVHLVGGPKMIETCRSLGALDQFGLMVLPILTAAGRQLTPDLDSDTALRFTMAREWPHGVIELTYEVLPTE